MCLRRKLPKLLWILAVSALSISCGSQISPSPQLYRMPVTDGAFMQAPTSSLTFSLKREVLTGVTSSAYCKPGELPPFPRFWFGGRAAGPYPGSFRGSGYFRAGMGGGWMVLGLSISSGTLSITTGGTSPSIACSGLPGQLPYYARLMKNGQTIASTSGYATVSVDLIHQSFHATF